MDSVQNTSATGSVLSLIQYTFRIADIFRQCSSDLSEVIVDLATLEFPQFGIEKVALPIYPASELAIRQHLKGVHK